MGFRNVPTSVIRAEPIGHPERTQNTTIPTPPDDKPKGRDQSSTSLLRIA